MKTLLVRMSSMGDLIHTLPAVDDLSRMRPDVELHWLCEAGFADIARLHPFVCEVHIVRWRQWRKELLQADTWRALGGLRGGLRSAHFDCVLDSQGLFKSALFSRVVGAPVWGLDSGSAREGGAAAFYQRSFAVAKGLDAVLRNRMLFAQAFSYEMPEEMRFGVVVPEAGFLPNLPERYYVALHATSRDSKLWRQDYWLDLMRRLYESDGGITYLPWGNEMERLRAQQMAEQLPYAQVCDRLTLLQAAYLLRGAQGVVGVDTGLLHLANALDKPLVGIYTDTDPKKTGVQTSARAENVGGEGLMPEVDEVFNLLKQGMAAAVL